MSVLAYASERNMPYYNVAGVRHVIPEKGNYKK